MQTWDGVGGKRVVITGATNGIGLAAAEQLAARGAQLAIVARSEARARPALERIRKAAEGAEVDVLMADLSDQSSVRALAGQILERYPRLDVLVNNAGAVFTTRQLSPDGIELTWAVNHLGPFVLTALLLDRLKGSAPARVVTTSSDAHTGAHIPFDDLDAERSYARRGFTRYGETKLANILFTAELGRRLAGTGVTANCFHPGVVATGFNRNNGPFMSLVMTLIRPFSRTPQKGAETLVWLVDSPEVSDEQGRYFVDKHRQSPTPEGQDMEAAHRLWEVSEGQTGLSVAAG